MFIDYYKKTLRVLTVKFFVGVTSYPRILDYKRFTKIIPANDSYQMADMPQKSGLVAADIITQPFKFWKYCCVLVAYLVFYKGGGRYQIIY